MRSSAARNYALATALTCALLLALLPMATVMGAAEVVSDDAVRTGINTAIEFDVMANDANGLTVVDHSAVTHGELTSDGDSVFRYWPHANFLGQDGFAYTVKDDSGELFSATVTIEVTGEIAGVEARSDRTSTEEDTAIQIPVLENDGAGPDGLPLVVALDAPPEHGNVEVQIDGSIVYTPDVNWSGSDELGYSISDGATTDAAMVTIQVKSIADLPDAVDDAILTDQGRPVEIEILANDFEADGDAVEFVEHSPPHSGVARWSENDAMISYQPNPDFFGVDTFTYAIADIDGADTGTVTITVDGRPAGTDDLADVNSGAPVSIVVLANDADPEAQPLTVASVERPNHGEASVAPDFTIRYVADAGFTGDDTFSYTLADPRGNTDSATVTVNVSPAGNLAPTASDDEYILDEDSPGNTLDVLANDSDPDGHALLISIDRSPEAGYLTVGANQVVIYTPNPEFNGTDSFVYSISDGNSGVDSATVTLNVQSANDLPVAVSDEFTVDEDLETVLTVLTNDADHDGDALVVEAVDDPPFGTATVNEIGELVYLPDKDYSGSDSITYTLSDGRGGTATATVTIVVIPVNDSPRTRNDQAATERSEPVNIPVLTNDRDPDDTSIAIAVETAPANGSAVLTAGNEIRYVPNSGFEGVDQFAYVATDDAGASDAAAVIVIVGEPELDPVAVKDDARTTVDAEVRIAVLENDSSPIFDPLTVTETSAPEHGTVRVSAGATVVYTPDDGYVGKDSFTYTITDADGRSDKARVYIAVKSGSE